MFQEVRLLAVAYVKIPVNRPVLLIVLLIVAHNVKVTRIITHQDVH